LSKKEFKDRQIEDFSRSRFTKVKVHSREREGRLQKEAP
jgi:hypothetical protein